MPGARPAAVRLAPRSPKLNGHVERSQRTHTEEFYECTPVPPTLPALRAALAEWETVYNTVLPHQALGYLPPQQFWEAYQRDPHAALAALPRPKPRPREAIVLDVKPQPGPRWAAREGDEPGSRSGWSAAYACKQ